MHGAQTSWSLGPFLLLIFVSLVLCWVRLSTRSLAASTMVHACYNFMLFSVHAARHRRLQTPRQDVRNAVDS